ncbi:hypothetical protein GUJ93_ZPchr0002g23091 [Zizania palustris]|nr:hypothetical protein GUJ93_ZPchr0002g23091 [Zizania palustris]
MSVSASPVQVVVGSFVPGYQMDQNVKKPVMQITTRGAAAGGGRRLHDLQRRYGGLARWQPAAGRAPWRRRRPAPASTSVFKVENWTAPTPAGGG